jgi:hypothetical protein
MGGCYIEICWWEVIAGGRLWSSPMPQYDDERIWVAHGTFLDYQLS